MKKIGLVSRTASTLGQKENNLVGYLKDMERVAEFKKTDFIPFFGKRDYEERILGYKFASLFSEEPKETKPILNKMEKREELLAKYNELIRGILLSGVLYGLYLLSD